MARCLTFINADIGGGRASLRIAGSRIAALGSGAGAGDLVVDLRGDRLLPGLINAHDHLHLNTLPPLESTGHWRHAREWVAQVNLRRRTDPAFESRLAVALDDRLLIGGLKNLLSGVTTVAHHDPLYPFLVSEHFPTAVLTNYGWSHSLYIDGEERVRNAYLRTPPDWPWIIHAAEGVDEEAAAEFERLDRLGCLGANTLIVHGIALERAQRRRLEEARSSLIWCPSSNFRLFGQTAQAGELVRRGRAALGTDSRFSGSRDLLCELNAARDIAALEPRTLESLVTRDAASLLRLADRGELKIGNRADLVVLPDAMALSGASRADIRLVVLAGRALYADADYARVVAPPTHWAAVRVDGKPKMLERRLAAALAAATLSEPGLEISDLTWAAA
ncbi:MAG TPA: amidohydrolase family protein [Steroidobacteraceae bacterium]|jgi:cytosine/adenosine deaminase-related metal-dependent hydrolase